jgi:hypothetical protein
MQGATLTETSLEKNKIKRKIVTIDPISKLAQERFEENMDGLHSCYVDDEVNETLYLTSVNKKYKFTMSKKNDSNWKLTK